MRRKKNKYYFCYQICFWFSLIYFVGKTRNLRVNWSVEKLSAMYLLLQLEKLEEEREKSENPNLSFPYYYYFIFLKTLISLCFFFFCLFFSLIHLSSLIGMEGQRERKMIVAACSPCAACKHLRRRCTLDCPFALYFRPDQPEKFINVHKVGP